MRNIMKQKLNQHRNLPLYLAMVSVIIAVFVAITLAPLPAYAEFVHGDFGQARHRELLDKRMKVLHDELKLSSAQESAWNVFIETSKPNEQPPLLDRSELSKLTTPERLDRMLSMMKLRQQKMESHAQSVKNFYSILTAEQQKVFDASFHACRVSMKNTKRSPLMVTA